MQAAGMVADYYGMQNQIRMGKMGADLEQAGITANIALTQAQSEDAALQNMRNLRQALGSQAAVMAGRGSANAGGTSISLMNNSVGEFNSDERARKINLLMNTTQLRAQSVLSSLHESASEAQIKKEFFKRSMNMIPGSSLGGFGGFGGGAGAASGGGSFGMTPV